MAKDKDTGINSDIIRDTIDVALDASRGLKEVSDTYTNILMKEKDAFEARRVALEKGNITEKQYVDALIKIIKTTNELDVGLKNTTKSNKMYEKASEELIRKLELSGQKVTKELQDRIIKSLGNLGATGILESQKELRRGGNNVVFKGTESNKIAKEIAQEGANKIGLKLDNLQYSLFSFLGVLDKENHKKQKGLLEDLVDNLGRSKFIGGVLNDTYSLIGLMGASWLAQFGQFGRTLGGIFYVAMQTAGPLIVNLLAKVLWSCTTKIISAILASKFFQGLGTKGGLILGTTALVGGAAAISGIDSIASGRRGNGGALIAGGLGIAGGGALLAGGAAASGAATAAATMGATGLAATMSTIAATLNPIGATLLGIGVAIAGIAYLWKKFHKSAEDHFNESKEHREAEKRHWWEEAFKSPTGPTYDDSEEPHETTKSGSGAILLKGVTKKVKTKENPNKTVFDPSKMSKADWTAAKTRDPIFGKHGEILNLGTMTTKRAEEVLAQQMQDNKKAGIKDFYEIVPLEYVDPRSMKTAPLARDSKGRVIGAYAGRGTTKLIEQEIRAAQKLGYKVSGAKMTGGILTLGDPDKGLFPESAYTGKGHGRTEGTTIDMYFTNSKGQQVAIGQQGIEKIFQKATGKKAPKYQVIAEHGNTIFHQEFGLTAEQQQLKPVKKQIVESTEHTIAPMQSAMKTDIQAYNEATKELQDRLNKGEDLKDSDIVEIIMKKMQGKGYKYNEDTNEWVKPSNNKTISSINPSGNNDFQQLQQSLCRVALIGTDLDIFG